MYLRILKKDLKRKKTMNVILLIFIILAATFIASSVSNMLAISTALDDYFEMTEAPDYWFAVTEESELARFEDFARANGYTYKTTDVAQMDSKDVTVSGKVFDYANTLCLSHVNTDGDVKLFDQNLEELTHVNDGELYVAANIFHSSENDFYEGAEVVIKRNGIEKKFIVKGYVRDIFFGSGMVGMTRFFISENDYAELTADSAGRFHSGMVYTDDASYPDKFTDLGLRLMMDVNNSTMRAMYLMEMLLAAVVLVVSVCLVIISMVILRFMIHFTMSEEFREIGVMKAIGIPDGRIRMLYIVKYLAVSVVGGVIGLAFSFPFGNLLISSASQNIIISTAGNAVINVICAAGTAAVVVLFCYFCTRKIKHFSPVDAIRNGETGERYSKKGVIRLGKSRLAPVFFMALNDILSGARRFASMLLIFALGILLLIIPTNTMNTLCSDDLITNFNMAPCDAVINRELIVAEAGSKEEVEAELEDIKKTLADSGIEADVFREVYFRMQVSCRDKKMSSMTFQGTDGVTTEQYSYMEGTPPRNKGEVAIAYVVADKIGAAIGDDVEIDIGGEVRTYMVTAIYQSMNNMGEGVRFYQEEELDYCTAVGGFGVQIRYTDEPDSREKAERKEEIAHLYPEDDVYTPGEYISVMIGDVAGQIESVKNLILGIILCINVLVTVLMVKSFITKEKGEIAILKAIGFSNASLALWQSFRIGLVLIISVALGILLSSPLSELIITPIFRIMGVSSVTYDVQAMEVYVIYPLLMLAATFTAAFFSAMGLRKISAAEASNIE